MLLFWQHSLDFFEKSQQMLGIQSDQQNNTKTQKTELLKNV